MLFTVHSIRNDNRKTNVKNAVQAFFRYLGCSREKKNHTLHKKWLATGKNPSDSLFFWSMWGATLKLSHIIIAFHIYCFQQVENVDIIDWKMFD